MGFDYDGTVCFTYQAGSITLKKHVTLVQGENTTAVAYEIINNGEAADFTITPLMNYREHNNSSTRDTLKFHKFNLTDTCGFMLIPESDPSVEIVLQVSEGELLTSEVQFDEDLQFATEVENEVTIVKEDIGTLVLGLPKNMDNSLGTRAIITLEFKELLEKEFKIPVIMEDERLTSVISNNILISANISRNKRKKKVDGMAAELILQGYLDKERK